MRRPFRPRLTPPARRSPRLSAAALIVVLAAPTSGALAEGSAPAGPAAGDAAATRPGAPLDTTDASGVRAVPLDDGTLTFPAPEDPDRPLMVLNQRLEDRIRAMAARSEKWADALRTLREHQFPVLVGSITQVETVVPELERYRFDGAGAAWLFTDGRDRPAAAAVTINLPKLVIRNRITGGDAEQMRRILELHLAHELYGHVIPIVESGNLRHPCADDPDPRAPSWEQLRSCVMEREKEVMVDLGYEPRDSYHWHFWNERIEQPGSQEGSPRPRDR